MGANHSKERPQEGVLSQMKNLLKSPNNNNNRPIAEVQRSTSRSSSLGSPPPSPRSLADTLASPQLQASFLKFLQDLDHNSGIPTDHCGRAGSLEFVLAVKKLQIEEGERRNRLEDWLRFFPLENKASGLVLNNDPQLWRRCAEATKKVNLRKSNLTHSCVKFSFSLGGDSKKSNLSYIYFTFTLFQEELTEEDLQALLLARDHCVKQLSREHQQFLVQRATEKATAMSKLASCCILLWPLCVWGPLYEATFNSSLYREPLKKLPPCPELPLAVFFSDLGYHFVRNIVWDSFRWNTPKVSRKESHWKSHHHVETFFLLCFSLTLVIIFCI